MPLSQLVTLLISTPRPIEMASHPYGPRSCRLFRTIQRLDKETYCARAEPNRQAAAASSPQYILAAVTKRMSRCESHFWVQTRCALGWTVGIMSKGERRAVSVNSTVGVEMKGCLQWRILGVLRCAGMC